MYSTTESASDLVVMIGPDTFWEAGNNRVQAMARERLADQCLRGSDVVAGCISKLKGFYGKGFSSS